MADAPVVHIGENSPEEVAYKLLKDIANVERKNLYYSSKETDKTASREGILKTYVECMKAVHMLPPK